MTNKIKEFLNSNKMVIAVVATVLVVGTSVGAYSGASQNVTESGDINVYNQVGVESEALGSVEMPDCANNSRLGGCPSTLGNLYLEGGLEADSTSYFDGATNFAGTATFNGALIASSSFNFRENGSALTATTTLASTDSGETYFISGGQKTITLPATSTLSAGTLFRFYVGGSITATTTIVTDSGANEIEGALIVAGAVVDCDAEDTIRFVEDGENIGDFVELRWSGTYWMIGPSGALTSAKMTCTAT